MRKATRSSYHRQIKYIRRNEDKLRKERISNSFLLNDSRQFWRTVSNIRGKNKKCSPIIEGFSNSSDISECFAQSYKNVFNQVGYDSIAMSNLYDLITDDIGGDCMCKTPCHAHVVSPNAIHEAVKCMKSGKGDGFDGLTSDYLLNASPLFFEYVSLLFTCMLFHSFSPTNFCISTMIPIPKGFNKDLSKTTNYRGIALSSLLSKIFDKCIIVSQNTALVSDDLQFAYKSGMSTVQCVSIVTETINYYLHNDSDVYMCTIDASKAFDRVNLFVLFSKLRRRNFCPLYLRFLLNSYCSQNMMVKWNDALSNRFTTSNGVKQGGVLSPLLFSVYLDDILHELRNINIGCHMNGHFVGAIVYADDITQ